MQTIKQFCDEIGIEPLSEALRCIDKYNLHHVWLVLEDGTRLFCHSKNLNAYPTDTKVSYYGLGGIAWDGTDWEFSMEFNSSGTAIELMEGAFLDALNDHNFLMDDEFEGETNGT